MSIRYDVRDDLDTIAAIIDAFPQELPFACGGSLSQRAVFVLGLPRSGTTLIEQVFLRIPGYGAAGEISDLSLIVGNHGRSNLTPPARDRLDLVRRSPQLDLATVGKDYLAATSRFGPTARLVDKTPLNFLYCALIAAALPNARMILLRRDPRDNLVGIFRTYFGGLYPYAYELTDLARYIVAFNKLADHWRLILSHDRLLELDYEAFVADPETQGKALAAFVGEDWNSDYLDPTNVRPAVSASAAQVRKPTTTANIGTWKNYAPWIGDALTVLDEYERSR